MRKLQRGTLKGAATALVATVVLAGGAASTRAQTTMMQSDAMMNMRAKNAQMVTQTLSEEKTEVAQLAAQQKQFKKMGGAQNTRIAAMFGRWIAEHQGAAPTLVKLIKNNGGDPRNAKILKAPVLGSKDKMLMATHKDHEAAVATSKMRAHATNDGAVRNAMAKRVALATRHLKEMAPYHKMMKMAMLCPHCHVAMKDGKCPMCGMKASDMKGKTM